MPQVVGLTSQDDLRSLPATCLMKCVIEVRVLDDENSNNICIRMVYIGREYLLELVGNQNHLGMITLK